METKFTDLSETRKSLVVEVPAADVDEEVERLSQRYRRSVRIPGFRPGKAPTKLIRQRMHDQILREVVHDLIPKVVDEALRKRGLEPVAAPNIRDVNLKEGHPLTFTATFETLPPVNPGNYRGLTFRRTPSKVTNDKVDQALQQLREQNARAEPVNERGIVHGDTVTVDLERRVLAQSTAAQKKRPTPERHENVDIEVGGQTNPPGFDEQLLDLEIDSTRDFTLTYPDNHDVKELAGAQVAYAVTIKGIRQRILPELDDAFARDLGNFDTLDALRARVQEDLEQHAEQDADRQVRSELLQQLATRLGGEVPEALVTKEIDRRVEYFVAHLVSQRIDPKRTGLDWEAFRNEQRAAATDAVRSTLVLDEIARREKMDVKDSEVEEEISRQAEKNGRTISATRALLQKDDGIWRLETGLRREKSIDFVLAHATIIAE